MENFKSFADLGKAFGIEPQKTKIDYHDRYRLTKKDVVSFVADPEGWGYKNQPPKAPKSMTNIAIDKIIEIFEKKISIADIVVECVGGAYDENDQWIQDNPVYYEYLDYIGNRFFVYDECDYRTYDEYLSVDPTGKYIVDQSTAYQMPYDWVCGKYGETSDKIKAAYAAIEQNYINALRQYEKDIALYNAIVKKYEDAQASINPIQEADAYKICDDVCALYEGGKGAIKRLKNILKNQYDWFEKYFELTTVYIVNGGYFEISKPNTWSDFQACSIDVYNINGEKVASRYLIK